MTGINKEPTRSFGWGAALLGGAVAIAGAAFLGTLAANVRLRMSLAEGQSTEQAYAALAASSGPMDVLLSLATLALPCAAGGYLSAKRGRGHALVQAGVAGAVALLFVVVVYLNPSSQPGPQWFIGLSLVTPVFSSVLGGWLYVRKI